MEGKKLLDTLSKIEGGEFYDIFNLLPDNAGGAEWIKEVKYTAGRVAEYLSQLEDYSLDDLRDLGNEYANSECETYYFNINAEVQALSLWASNEIDEEVAELAGWAEDMQPTLTKLQSLYLFVAKRMVWDAVADQAFTNTSEERELENA